MKGQSNPVRIAIVEDNALYRSLLGALISAADGFDVVATCESVREARERIVPGVADVVLMDIGLPDGNGFGLARSLRTGQPDLGVVLLSSHDVMDLLLALPAKDRRGWSYLSKTSATAGDTVLTALRTSAGGGSMLDPELVQALEPRKDSPLARLTPRQLDALRLLASGRSNAAIAREMQIGSHAIDNLLNNVYKALEVGGDSEVNSRVSAALMLLRHGAPAEGV